MIKYHHFCAILHAAHLLHHHEHTYCITSTSDTDKNKGFIGHMTKI